MWRLARLGPFLQPAALSFQNLNSSVKMVLMKRVVNGLSMGIMTLNNSVAAMDDRPVVMRKTVIDGSDEVVTPCGINEKLSEGDDMVQAAIDGLNNCLCGGKQNIKEPEPETKPLEMENGDDN